MKTGLSCNVVLSSDILASPRNAGRPACAAASDNIKCPCEQATIRSVESRITSGGDLSSLSVYPETS